MCFVQSARCGDVTHPSLGDGERLGAVAEEGLFPLGVTPPVQARLPQLDGCQTRTAHV